MIKNLNKIIILFLIFMLLDTGYASPGIKADIENIKAEWSDNLMDEAKTSLTESLKDDFRNRCEDEDPNIREGASNELTEYIKSLSLPYGNEIDILNFILTALSKDSDAEVASRAKYHLDKLNPDLRIKEPIKKQCKKTSLDFRPDEELDEIVISFDFEDKDGSIFRVRVIIDDDLPLNYYNVQDTPFTKRYIHKSKNIHNIKIRVIDDDGSIEQEYDPPLRCQLAVKGDISLYMLYITVIVLLTTAIIFIKKKR